MVLAARANARAGVRPLHYARQRGSARVRLRLLELAEIHGQRFAPSDAWQQVFAAG